MPAPARFTSQALGALPILNRFFEHLRLREFFEQCLPREDARSKLPCVDALLFLLRSLLLARGPLYGLQEWAGGFDEGALGLPRGAVALLNDDRVGRSLDRLFRSNRAALMTSIVVHAIHHFKLDLSELHNDSTTVTFSGAYEQARGQARYGQDTHRITFGHNKDYRPDLKQLLWILSTTADGSIPLWCHIEHGNTADDQTHIGTWETLRTLVGSADFLYVADSKLCTKENMGYIAQRRGRFLTVLPRTRAEDGQFRDWVQSHDPPWQELLRKPKPRPEAKDHEDVYQGFESPLCSVEGYRIVWILSSQKQEHDRAIREGRIAQAVEGLQQLQARLDSPRSRLKTRAKVDSAVLEVLQRTQAQRWLNVEVHSAEQQRFKQAQRGRPNANTLFVQADSRARFRLQWQSNLDSMRYDGRTDGLFPLVLNDATLSVNQALLAYKHQPHLEKRHEQLKTVFAIMPVNLKNHLRVEALLFLYFIALLVESLIEREVRRNMKGQRIESLPVYHEGRLCKAPTAALIFDLFAPLRKHCLFKANGSLAERRFDPLNKTQRIVLDLFGLSPKAYFAAGD